MSDDAEAMRRLRWHSRRGMLENDLLLERFLDSLKAPLPSHERDAMNELLALSDADLLPLLLGRSTDDAPDLSEAARQLLPRIRAAQ